MKIRQGHVSNSSSSSFCIYGVCFREYGDGAFTRKNLINLLIKKEEVVRELIKYKGEDQSIEDFMEMVRKSPNSFDLFDIIDKVNNGLESFSGHCDDKGVYVGRDFTSIKDEETGKQFKESVEKDIKGFLGINVECNIIKEGWYDG